MLFFKCKDNANRKENKINPFIFYAEVWIVFAFMAKIIQNNRMKQRNRSKNRIACVFLSRAIFFVFFIAFDENF